MNYNKQLFLENMVSLQIPVTEEQTELLDSFAGMLIEKSKVMNLTAILDEDGIAVKHFADSLSVLKAVDIKENTKVLDLGTGAGFPGIPLLISHPEINLTCLDSTAKKLAFVKESIENLGLSAQVLHSRAEEAGKTAEHREQYDYVVSRAVASLNVLCEYCLPFVRVGGTFVAMKAAAADEEIKAASNALGILGGKICDRITFNLSDMGERNLIIIKKIKETPVKYPRPSAQIAKKAL